MKRWLVMPSIAAFTLVAMLGQVTWALAGTTGAVSGSVTDTSNGKPLSNATVTAVSPSQSATTKTDASGHFAFLTLAPDTYTVSVDKDGYAPASVSGVTVFADQTQTVGLSTQPQIKTIARVTSRAAGNLVKPGTTSDVYSVNAATQYTVQGFGGGHNLDSAYSAIYAQPGVQGYIGNSGFGQVFYIRGSHYSQVGYEYDGIPVNRAFDNYNANSLSSFGSQETEVYTGGSPAGGSSATLAGYINQVIKTGTYPGFGSLLGGAGVPTFYHKLSAEVGGASPNRLFSYYVGASGANQDQRFYTNTDGGGWNPDGSTNGLSTFYFSPLETLLNPYQRGPFSTCTSTGTPPSGAATYGGLPTCLTWAPFAANFTTTPVTTQDRENIANVHFAIPHKNDSGRDDVQLLYYNFAYHSIYEDGIDDNGGLPFFNTAFTGWGGPGGYAASLFGVTSYPGQGGPFDNLCAYQAAVLGGCATSGTSPLPYFDTFALPATTSFGQSANGVPTVNYLQPSSPQNRQPNAGIPTNLRDALWNDGSVVKLQYQKNFGTNAYLRAFGYTFYSDWLQSSANGAATYGSFIVPGEVGFGYPSPNYELNTHTRGLQIQFADQLDPKNLFRFTGNYTTATILRNNNQYYIQPFIVSNYLGTDGNCYDFTTGALASCLNRTSQGTYNNLAPGTAPGGSPGALAGAQWIVTRPGGFGPLNTVKPVFASVSFEDEFKPTDRWDLNLGVRGERYEYDFQDLNNPEFGFWFKQAASAYCYDPDTKQPLVPPPAPGAAPSQNPAINPNLLPGEQPGFCYDATGAPLLNAAGHQLRHPNGQNGSLLYTNVGPLTTVKQLWSPRVAGTYSMSPDSVLRFSYGRYTQPTETAFEQYGNLSGYGAATFDFAHFFGLGFLTPVHDNPVQVSNNYDLSFEHHLKGTDMTLKVTPFYRYTTNQLVTVSLGGTFASGINAGTQRTTGVELAFQKGDPTRDGLSGQLSYTWTRAEIKYSTLANGVNSIDVINNDIITYNQLTNFCKTHSTDARCGNLSAVGAANIAPCYDPTAVSVLNPASNAPSDCSKATDITNPYFNAPVQGLLDRNGWYPVYTNQPPGSTFDTSSFSAISPNVFAGWLSYKHNRVTLAMSAQLLEGAQYGSPSSIIGLDPRACTQNQLAAGVEQAGSQFAQNADYQSCAPSPFATSGYLAIPNPYTGSFDGVGLYREPWQFNLGFQVAYDISPRIRATATLANVVNTCFGGSSTPWSKAWAPGQYVCGYNDNFAANPLFNGSFIGTQPGAGWFYGASGHDPVNGTAGYAKVFDYPYVPLTGANPFQAYFQLQLRV